MNALTWTAQLAGLTSLIALLWLTVSAFKKHIAWGFAVLLLSPISATIFSARYWGDAKKPFLFYITTFATAVALGIYLFTSWGGWELLRTSSRVQQGIESQTLTDEDATAFMNASLNFIENSGLDLQEQQELASIREQLPGNAAQPAEEEPVHDEPPAEKEFTLRSMTKKVMPQKENYRLKFVPIEVADARKYVGSTVKVKRKNVAEKEYRITGATANTLEFSRRSRGGSFSFNYKYSDIENIRVLTKQLN